LLHEKGVKSFYELISVDVRTLEPELCAHGEIITKYFELKISSQRQARIVVEIVDEKGYYVSKMQLILD
jgi:hypothetical protein